MSDKKLNVLSFDGRSADEALEQSKGKFSRVIILGFDSETGDIRVEHGGGLTSERTLWLAMHYIKMNMEGE